MNVALVRIKVKPEFVEAFIQATVKNHESSVREPGNLRFDFLRQLDDPYSFVLYEAYANPESAALHKETPHYREWKATVEPMMAEPRSAAKYLALRPLF
jgi:autoinducer 2-degrading protein